MDYKLDGGRRIWPRSDVYPTAQLYTDFTAVYTNLKFVMF